MRLDRPKTAREKRKAVKEEKERLKWYQGEGKQHWRQKKEREPG